MASYTLEELEAKTKKVLIGITQELNLDSSGNRSDLISRIYEHKPNLKDMIASAPVSTDGDITVNIEDVSDKEVETTTDAEVPDTPEPEAPAAEVVEEPVAPVVEKPADPVVPTMSGSTMVPENTMEDILKNWRSQIQNKYRKQVKGPAPARPLPSLTIAQQIGVPNAIGQLEAWKGAIIAHMRPTPGYAPVPPTSIKGMIRIIKSL
jgi:hypothetical protein